MHRIISWYQARENYPALPQVSAHSLVSLHCLRSTNTLLAQHVNWPRMWRGNPGRSDPSWNRPLHTHSDGWDTPSVRRFNSKLIGKILSLKWAVTELRLEKAKLQRLLSSLDYERSSIRAVLEQVKTERDKLLADLEEVRTERDTLLAAKRASDGIMQRKQNLSSCFMSSAGADYEQFESKSVFASTIVVADKIHPTPSSFPWDGFYEPKAGRDPASPHPPPNLADKEEEYSSPASSTPRAVLNADKKDYSSEDC